MNLKHVIDPALHSRLFTEFCDGELSTGGPDPQVLLAAAAAADADAWRAVCFVGPYTLGAGAAIWKHWSLDRVLDGGEAALAEWLREHWAGLPIRRERRAVWKPEKLARCLVSGAAWVAQAQTFETYEAAYASVTDTVQFFGRYATMKFLEVLHQAGLLAVAQTDIRPRGAWSPRRTLGMLQPDLAGHEKSDSAEELNWAHVAAILQLANLRIQLGRADWIDPSETVSWFQFETLLCNYRQALDGKYPGRSHDRELAHFRRAEAHFGPDLWPEFYDLRLALFPAACLGERKGWDGARKDLEKYFDDTGRFWVDTKYDYAAYRRGEEITHG